MKTLPLQIGHIPVYRNRNFWIQRRTTCNVNPEVFFIAHPHQHQKRIDHSHQGYMMMPALPGATLEMIQADLHLHFSIILLHSETSFGLPNQSAKGSPLGTFKTGHSELRES